jgi:hypothetical protein
LRVRPGNRPSLFPLQVKRYTDDLQVLHTYTQLIENPGLGTLDVANTTFLVVDDVLFKAIRFCVPAPIWRNWAHVGSSPPCWSTGISVSNRSGPTLSACICKSPPMTSSNATYRRSNRSSALTWFGMAPPAEGRLNYTPPLTPASTPDFLDRRTNVMTRTNQLRKPKHHARSNVMRQRDGHQLSHWLMSSASTVGEQAAR